MMELELSDKIQRVLGSGWTGQVYEVLNASGEVFARKTYQMSFHTYAQLGEYILASHIGPTPEEPLCQFTGLVLPVAYAIHPRFKITYVYYPVMEGDLFARMDEGGNSPPINQYATISRQDFLGFLTGTSRGLDTMHAYDIVHHDVSVRKNVLIKDDTFCLADLHRSRQSRKPAEFQKERGLFVYEILDLLFDQYVDPVKYFKARMKLPAILQDIFTFAEAVYGPYFPQVCTQFLTDPNLSASQMAASLIGHYWTE